MTQLICYAEEHGADAIGLACSVFAPVVETARELVNVPVLSPYDSVMAEAVENGESSPPSSLRCGAPNITC
ncbi:MAG: aspartate/glutamate racemase family protein [Dehalococcoidia bacterium]|nr:aspartate/glutamate racemase family protein [Dehalococcoidia bacterium]